MKKLLFLLLFFSGLVQAGEEVTVTWTPPDDISELPYDGYVIHYTDSADNAFMIPIPIIVTDPVTGDPVIDPVTGEPELITKHVIPNVEFGASKWAMTSLCTLCTVPESVPSQTIDFTVKSKIPPKPPNIITITVTVVVQ